MDLTKIQTPEHVVGKSLLPIFNDTNFKIRNSALTRLNVMQGGGNGYSIKSERYRLTKWGEKGELGYELYDHKNDKEELINLAENKKYYEVLDSLKKEIDKRITQARQKPKGLGRQSSKEHMLELNTLLVIYMILKVKEYFSNLKMNNFKLNNIYLDLSFSLYTFGLFQIQLHKDNFHYHQM